jgi:hypothetical protein
MRRVKVAFGLVVTTVLVATLTAQEAADGKPAGKHSFDLVRKK